MRLIEILNLPNDFVAPWTWTRRLTQERLYLEEAEQCLVLDDRQIGDHQQC